MVKQRDFTYFLINIQLLLLYNVVFLVSFLYSPDDKNRLCYGEKLTELIQIRDQKRAACHQLAGNRTTNNLSQQSIALGNDMMKPGHAAQGVEA